ncbi:MAG: hypothetical protein EOP84_24695 [Verrucomicrobiaceae bacterium]|nr:MAG: hypothetical protein EOP84_24695 [Verrucomicrobiaceae bacterium]
MAEVIRFKSKTHAREKALQKLAHRVLTHLIVSFYDRGIMDVPVQAYVKEMTNALITDGHAYDPAVLDSMGMDINILMRLEAMLIRTLVQEGQLPADYKL